MGEEVFQEAVESLVLVKEGARVKRGEGGSRGEVERQGEQMAKVHDITFIQQTLTDCYVPGTGDRIVSKISIQLEYSLSKRVHML